MIAAPLFGARRRADVLSTQLQYLRYPTVRSSRTSLHAAALPRTYCMRSGADRAIASGALTEVARAEQRRLALAARRGLKTCTTAYRNMRAAEPRRERRNTSPQEVRSTTSHRRAGPYGSGGGTRMRYDTCLARHRYFPPHGIHRYPNAVDADSNPAPRHATYASRAKWKPALPSPSFPRPWGWYLLVVACHIGLPP